LARILVPAGIGFNQLAEIAKAAYVSAATDDAPDAQRKISVARIAASTGLTRVETSKILKATSANQTQSLRSLNRGSRMAVGWLSDKTFLRSNGKPKALPFEGKGATFSSLTKKYSGDIPGRAMLAEMLRTGMVKQGENDVIQLVRSRTLVRPTTVSALNAIHPWISVLAKSVQPDTKYDLTSTTERVRLSFDSMPQVLAAVRILNERKVAFLESVSELGAYSPDQHKFHVEFSFAMAASKPSKITRASRKK
jgi:hypothetical protein